MTKERDKKGPTKNSFVRPRKDGANKVQGKSSVSKKVRADFSGKNHHGPEKRHRLPGTLSDSARIARMVRVDHAGEYGAQRIYAGQIAVLGDRKIGKLLRHMAAQEDVHLAAFEQELKLRKIRPTALHPLWTIAGFALGAFTAKLGEKAAMACTVAVEEVIDEHYKQQLTELPATEKKLRRLITQFRDEEIEHKHIGLEAGAEDVPYYAILRAVVRAGSKTAIWLSERV